MITDCRAWLKKNAYCNLTSERFMIRDVFGKVSPGSSLMISYQTLNKRLTEIKGTDDTVSCCWQRYHFNNVWCIQWNQSHIYIPNEPNCSSSCFWNHHYHLKHTLMKLHLHFIAAKLTLLLFSLKLVIIDTYVEKYIFVYDLKYWVEPCMTPLFWWTYIVLVNSYRRLNSKIPNDLKKKL